MQRERQWVTELIVNQLIGSNSVSGGWKERLLLWNSVEYGEKMLLINWNSVVSAGDLNP